MALSDFQSAETIARSRRGTVTRSLGAKSIPQANVVEKPGNLPGPIQKAADVGKQIGSIGATLGKKTGGFVANTAVDIVRSARGTASTLSDLVTYPIRTRANEENAKVLRDRLITLSRDYAAGTITRENYERQKQDVTKGLEEINKSANQIATSRSVRERNIEIAETAANYLTLGRGTLGQVGGKQIVTTGAKANTKTLLTKEATEALVKEAATGLERAVMRVPAVKDLIIRNLQAEGKRELQKLAGESATQFLAREAKQVAINLLIKRPIFYQSNIAQAESLYDNLLQGDYKGAVTDAAWLGVQMVSGGPVGVFFKGKDYLKGGLRDLAYGRQSFIDELSKRIGDGNQAQIARFLTKLKDRAPEEYKEAERTFRILQETNLRTAGEDVGTAVDNVLEHYVQHGYDPANITPSQLYKDMRNWARADEIAQNALKSGKVRNVNPEDAGRYVVVRWDQTARQGLIEAYRQGGVQAVAELMQRPGVAWTNNSIIVNRVEALANQARNVKEFEAGVKAITAADSLLSGLPKSVAKELAELGYSVATPIGGRITPVISDIQETRRLVSGAIRGATDVFDPSTAPQPEVQAIAGFLRSAGVSPEATNEVAQRALAESVISNLDRSVAGSLGVTFNQGGDVVNGGRAILTRLKQFVEDRPAFMGLGKRSAVTDIRQLTNREIAEALGISVSDAKEVSRAIMKGYQDVPLELRGLGDKVVDTLFRVNPMQKYYSRIQAALRYTYNPFFRLQERAETAIFSRTQANNLIWNKSREQLNDAARVLDESGIFTSSLPGEAAQDVVLGRITANITQAQKRDLAGLAMDMAQARGVDLDTMIAQHSDELEDALRVVVQYPRQGVLASPLARTLNLAFFPMRYNAKVTMLAAQSLAKQPPSVQKAVLHSLFQTREWLKSEEGIRWQRDHADAIQILKWVTPVNSIESTFKLLTGNVDSPGELGQLGGLPLGVISQILDGQGIITLNKPYVNPKTGDVIPRYIPQSTKARAAVALGDLLNSMFTYPGRIMGLPGKEQGIRKFVELFIDTNGADFEKRLDLEALSPLQRKWVEVLKGDTSKEAIDALYNSPAPGQFNWYTLPPMDLPLRNTVPEGPRVTPRRGLPTKKQQAAAKKAASKKTAKPLAQPIQ